MKKNDTLKSTLQRIKENNYELNENDDIYNLSMSMMNQIGSLDPDLRDHLIYSTFYVWFTRDYLEVEHMKTLLNIAMCKNHLFFNLERIDNTSVYKRAFSSLVIALVLYKDLDQKFLSFDETKNVFKNLKKYSRLEYDFRGHVHHFGWADSRAHLSDALAELAKSRHLDRDDLFDLLMIIRDLTKISTTGTASNDGDRLLEVVSNIIDLDVLTQDDYIKWINSYSDIKKPNAYPEKVIMMMNIKSFLYPLYLKCNQVETLGYLKEHIEVQLKE